MIAILFGTALVAVVLAAGFSVQSQCQIKPDVMEIGKRTTALVYYHTRADVDPYSPPDPNVIGAVSGSAFCITNTGYYITNAHVVKRSYKSVMLSVLPYEKGMKTFIADVVAVDNNLDLALLKAPIAAALQPLELANSVEIATGFHVTGFGFPAPENDDDISEATLFTPYYAMRSSSGHISSLYGEGRVLEDFVMDTGLVHGASGGPVLDDRGRLVGVIQKMFVGTKKNLSISVNRLAEFLHRPANAAAINKPEMVFDSPQSISFESAVHGAALTVRCVTPFGPTPSGLKAAIVLSTAGGSPHVFTGTSQGGGVFRFTGQAITPTVGLPILSVGITGDSSTDSHSSALQVLDGPITVGTRSLKFSDISLVDQGDGAAPSVVLKSGEILNGPVHGLASLRTAPGGANGIASIEKAKQFAVIDPFSTPTTLDYRVTLKTGSTTIGDQSGHISIADLPVRHMGRPVVIVTASPNPTNSTGSSNGRSADLSPASKRYVRNTLDVLLGDPANETSHNRQSKDSIMATRLGFTVRDAPEVGWLSYTLRCSPKNPSTLDVYYLGGDANGRDFDVIVDGSNVQTLSLKRGVRGLSTIQNLQIPAELTTSKEHVEIRFVSLSGNDTCGITSVNLHPIRQRMQGPVLNSSPIANANNPASGSGAPTPPGAPRIGVRVATTLDRVDIGNDASERDHNLQGDNTKTAAYIGRQWRSAFDGGWFSYTMKVDPAKQVGLDITYYGGDGAGRDFDILIDGEKLVDVSLRVMFGGNRFYPRLYNIPQSMTKGKNSIVVTFKDHPGNIAGGIYGCGTVVAP